MKKHLLLIASAFCFVNISHAQISKGSILLGGSFGFNSQNNTNDYYTKSDSYSIYPVVGVAVKTNNVAGLELRFYRSHYLSKYDTSTATAKGVGLWDRQYWTIVKRLYVYANFEGTYDATKTDDHNGLSSSLTTSTEWTVGVSASPGVAFEVTKWFYLESGFNNLLYVNYDKRDFTTTGPSGTNSYTSKNASGGINLTGAAAFIVGFRFIIAKG